MPKAKIYAGSGAWLGYNHPSIPRAHGCVMRFLNPHTRSRTASLDLGHLESTVMDVMWTIGESSVHEVLQRMDRPLAYTTVMTTLDRLFKKGLLDRRKSDRAFFYSPRLSRQEWERKVAADFLARFLAAPSASNELLASCLVDAAEQHNAALLDELEKKIRMKRNEAAAEGES